MTVREIALSLLTEYEEQGKYINLSLSSHLTDSLSREERGFLTMLLYTTVEHKITYDYYIGAISGRSLSDITGRVKNILRLGFCQILHMEKIPDFAAVSETVKLAKGKGEKAFVNAVLREAVRSKDNLPMPKREKNEARYLCVLYSFPLATVKRFISVLGSEQTEKLLNSFNTASYTDITVNKNKTTKEELKKILEGEGVSAIDAPYGDVSLRISGGFDPRRSPAFEEGLFFVQDNASLLAVLSAGIEEGDTVADVCAAPGGKSFAAAGIAGNGGKVFSFELHESKISLIESGRDRLGLSNMHIEARDALCPNEELFGKTDKVICDVPCSGLGILGKKSDIRYKDITEIEDLPALQYSILEKSSLYLKEGGILVYSTCTLNPAENGDVVEKFMKEHPEFIAVDFAFEGLESKGGCLTLMPHIHNTDGFFIAKLKKRR